MRTLCAGAVLGCGRGVEQLPDFGGMAIPSPVLRRLDGGLTDATTKGLVIMKLLEQLGQRQRVIGIAENEAVDIVADESGHSREAGCDHRETTGHRFRNRQSEGIFAAGADVEVGGCVKINHVTPRTLPLTSMQDAQAFGHFTERLGGIVAYDKKMQGQSGSGSHCSENRWNAFHKPIISDQ